MAQAVLEQLLALRRRLDQANPEDRRDLQQEFERVINGILAAHSVSRQELLAAIAHHERRRVSAEERHSDLKRRGDLR